MVSYSFVTGSDSDDGLQHPESAFGCHATEPDRFSGSTRGCYRNADACAAHVYTDSHACTTHTHIDADPDTTYCYANAS